MLDAISLSILELFVGLFLSSVGIIVGRKLYKNVSKEDHKENGKVIQRLLKTYAIAQCIAWPSLMAFSWIIYVNATVIKVIPPFWVLHAISTGRGLYILLRTYVGFNSMIIAIGRYCFIVFETQTSRFRIKTIRYLFISCSVGIPIFLTLANEATIPIERPYIAIFMPQYNDTYQSNVNHSIWVIEKSTIEAHQSILYSIVNHYVPTTITYGVGVFCKPMTAVIFSNVVEGFIYIHTFVYSIR